jgi:streptogramin lyase
MTMAIDPWLVMMRCAMSERAVRENWFVGISEGTAAEMIPAPSAAARIVYLKSGIQAIRLSPAVAFEGDKVPLVEVSVLPSATGGATKIVAPTGQNGCWLSGEGGGVVIRVPSSGGAVVLTVYSSDGEAAVPPIEIRPVAAFDKSR